MPRREALGDVRADEASATGEKDAHAGGRASSIERVEIFADYLDDVLTNTARASRTLDDDAHEISTRRLAYWRRAHADNERRFGVGKLNVRALLQ